MILTTILKAGAQSMSCILWFCLMVVIIADTAQVAAHAPPRALYYGHRVQPREPLKHIPASLLLGSSRDSVYDMPSCSQLRSIWRSSVKNYYNSDNNNLETNEIPMLINNPYYAMLLWNEQQKMQQTPHFGKILNGPTDRDANRVSSNRAQNTYQVTPIPGRFMDRPTQIGVVYGHVINSPDEAQQRTLSTDTQDNTHRNKNSNDVGFGDFVTQEEDNDKSKSNAVINRHSQNSKQQRTGSSSSSFSSAEDFFKSGIWHNKPVIESVSFRH